MAKTLRTRQFTIDGKKYLVEPPKPGKSRNHAVVKQKVQGPVRNGGQPFWRTVPMGSPRHLEIVKNLN